MEGDKMSKPFLMQFDPNPSAVLEPDHEQAELDYHFPKKLLFAFITSETIAEFLAGHEHREIGVFECFEGATQIYEVQLETETVTFCQAKIGAAAAVELLDWLIGYGVRQVIAIGSAGVLVDLPENYFLVPIRAI